jgi:hypothetical protein
MSTTAFPTGGREIVERMTRKFPDEFVNVDEEQRKLTKKIGEQFAFVYGRTWGNKKRTGLSDDQRSKDSAAVQESDGTTSVWDMFSSGLDILVHDGDLPEPGTHANLPPSEATFIPCTPINWLGDDVPGPEPEPPPPDPSELEARVTALEAAQAHQVGVNDAHEALIAALTAAHHQLEQRVIELEKPLRVVGKTTATWGHQHTVNLDVRG